MLADVNIVACTHLWYVSQKEAAVCHEHPSHHREHPSAQRCISSHMSSPAAQHKQDKHISQPQTLKYEHSTLLRCTPSSLAGPGLVAFSNKTQYPFFIQEPSWETYSKPKVLGKQDDTDIEGSMHWVRCYWGLAPDRIFLASKHVKVHSRSLDAHQPWSCLTLGKSTLASLPC